MNAPVPPRDRSVLRDRRREQAQRRRLARLDVALGLLLALVLVLATPGLAIAAVIGLLVIVICLVSVALERFTARRRTAGRRIVPRVPARSSQRTARYRSGEGQARVPLHEDRAPVPPPDGSGEEPRARR